MNETIDCTNCCIADFKHSLCDCNGDFCTKYKSIGDENDFMQAVLMDRPSGEWKRKIVDNGFNADWVCSECGYRVKTDFVDYHYCPHCGCRMKGAEDE